MKSPTNYLFNSWNIIENFGVVFFSVKCVSMQNRKHHGQHAAHDGKVRQQPGRAGG